MITILTVKKMYIKYQYRFSIPSTLRTYLCTYWYGLVGSTNFWGRKYAHYAFGTETYLIMSKTLTLPPKIKTFVEKILKMDRAVLAVAVGMLYVTFPNRIYSYVLSPRHLRLCRCAFWDSKLCEVHTSHLRSILDKMGGATHPGMWSVLVWMRSLNWNCTWSLSDDVSEIHKNTSIDKYAYWETAINWMGADVAIKPVDTFQLWWSLSRCAGFQFHRH